MKTQRWGASLLAAAVAVSGLAVGGVTLGAEAALAEPVEAPTGDAVAIDDAVLEWGYSKYAQVGVIGA